MVKKKMLKIGLAVVITVSILGGATANASAAVKNQANRAVVKYTSNLMKLPSHDGEVAREVGKGEILEVYLKNVNVEWAAVLTDDDGLLYILQEEIEYFEEWTDTTTISEDDSGKQEGLLVEGELTNIKQEPKVLFSGVDKQLPFINYEYSYMADLTQLTGYSGTQLEKAIADSELKGLGEEYAMAERKYGVNALFIMAVTIQESGWGESDLAKGQNNLGGLVNGEGGYQSFVTKAECIDYMGQHLAENYLAEDGAYYHGKTSRDVAKIYCNPPQSWYEAIESIMETCYESITEVEN